MENFIGNLRQKLSKASKILTKDDAEFATAHERWTDIDRETPAVIVQPANEQDIALLVNRSPHFLLFHMIRQLEIG